jgi:cysteine-rich repeat protein
MAPRLPFSRLLLCAALLGATGCTVLVDGAINGSGGPPPSSCAGLRDGTQCTLEGIIDELVCIRGACVTSECGDGIVDDRSEECDDGNVLPGDECAPDCLLVGGCEIDDDCPLGDDTCAESYCDPATGACLDRLEDDDTPCTSDLVASGSCRDGYCFAAGCGDGVLDATEECDDGNMEPGDGCSAFCKPECRTDDECIQDPCFGTQTCVLSTEAAGMLGRCEVSSSPLDCGDPSCAYCDSSTGVAVCVPTETADADLDGFTSLACGGDDCDDANFLRNPGLTEECDAERFDSDCNPDNEPTGTTWYADCDGDGYAAERAATTMRCERPTAGPTTCPSGTWTSRVPTSGADDCLDSNANVRPGAGFSGTPYTTPTRTTSFDYNCDGVLTAEYGAVLTPALASCGTGPCSTRPPSPVFPLGVDCGEEATLYSCVTDRLSCVRTASSRPVTKRCR